MHILLLGGTGNLGLRLLPALIAHGHTVVALVRSESKLRGLISPELFALLTIYIGDALDTNSVETALRKYGCDGIMNTAGNFAPPWKEQYLGKIATSVSGAAVRVGRERGKVLRAWFIGGITCLVYPYEGNDGPDGGWKVQDYFPKWAPDHHGDTERALKQVSVRDLEWSLLCVAWMRPASTEIGVLERPRGNGLIVKAGVLPEWESGWVGGLPVVGRFLEVMWAASFGPYSTTLEDTADLLAEDLASGRKELVGCAVGMKDTKKGKSKSKSA